MCGLLLLGLTALPCLGQETDTTPQVRPEHPRLLLTSLRLQRLQELSLARSEQWRRLLSWALEPARRSAQAPDGPGLALCALVLRQKDPELSKQLAQLAVRCALNGARTGKAQSVSGHGRTGQNSLGDEPQLLRAAPLVQQVALTLDWAWPAFTPEERQRVSDWLTAQAKIFSKQGLGCFDSESAAALSITALAGLAAFGSNPAAADLVNQAWQQRYRAHLRPCLLQRGQGGGWFEGDTPGARAGLDLLLFAAAFHSATGLDPTDKVTWFDDRLSYLLFHLLPGLATAQRRSYRRTAPGGDAMLPPEMAAELVRMQMLALMALRPDDPASGAARALLLDPSTPGLLYGHNYVYDFLWVDPSAPTAPLATAPLSHLAQAVGRAVLRSDWSERATWLGFSCGPHFALRQHLDAGDLLIFRGSFLLPPGGGYDGPRTSHALNYAIRSVAANTLLIHDPKEYSWYDLRAGRQPRGAYSNDGGQRAWALFGPNGQLTQSAPWTASGLDSGPAPWSKLGPIYNVAQIEALEDQPRYAYLRGRATAAYDGSTHKVKRLVRHVFLLRSNGPDDAEAAEAVVVADDLVLARPGLSVRFALHFPQQPSSQRPLSKLAPGRWQGPASPLVLAAGEARLNVVPIRPADSRLEIMGGPGAASWVDGRNYPSQAPASNSAPWRAEFVAASPASPKLPLLHVLLPADQNAPPPPAISPLNSKDEDTVGVVIKDPSWPRVLVLRLGPPSVATPIIYGYPAGYTRHLVAGLLPETEYQVQVEPERIIISPGKGIKSSRAGLLAFRVGPPPKPAPPPAPIPVPPPGGRSRGQAR
ncbi:MAG: hypothetical protein C4525_06625 [Desulfarculus sp.]|nr:MAG: hypothetical protein C4525_06625 [Desulfarculus sp.]